MDYAYGFEVNKVSFLPLRNKPFFNVITGIYTQFHHTHSDRNIVTPVLNAFLSSFIMNFEYVHIFITYHYNFETFRIKLLSTFSDQYF